MYPILCIRIRRAKKRCLPELAAEKMIGCFGLTEAYHSSDPGSMETKAVKKGDKYILNGAKMWITNGSIAEKMG